MYEIEFIGRGGQGAKSAAEIVARSAIKKGMYVQSFPDYGPERKGAPVRAFTRTSNTPIRGCSNEANPDVVVVIDPTLLSLNNTFFRLSDSTMLIANTTQTPQQVGSMLGFNGTIFTIDATSIALKYLKGPITNTTMLGAVAKATGYYTLEELHSEINDEFSRKISAEMIAANLNAAQCAFEQVQR